VPDLDESDGSPVPLHIGDPCTPEAHQCGIGQVCLRLKEGSGVCTLPNCTMELIETSQREDSCPEGSACTEVSIVGPLGYEYGRFCLRVCEPVTDHNPCAEHHPDLACSPASIFATGHTEVCGELACNSDLECNLGNPMDPNASCDTTLNLCFLRGTPEADIGSPCKASTECGEGQYCLPEARQGDVVYLPGGYCTKVGCRYGGPWACPEGSACYSLGAAQALSLCMATGCDPKAPEESDGCRDESSPADAYECLVIDAEGVCWQPPE